MRESGQGRIEIDGARLLADLARLRAFGAEGPGVVRRAFSEVDIASRQWLAARLRDAGLEPILDGIGNVIGSAPRAARALLMGSHTDTQPQGGWLDGSLGVICALEIARAAREQHGDAFPIDVASWMDEEGCYLTCLGSRSFCGKLTEHDIDTAASEDGRSLRTAIAAAGLAHLPRASLDPKRHVAYLETHIEQGCVLEKRGRRIGVVTAIVGGAAFRVVITGQQNHAGTTPMTMRRDAGVAFVDLARRIHAEFGRMARETTVWTIGEVRFVPGAVNTIPGRCEFSIEFREVEADRIRRLAERLRQLVAELDSKEGFEVEVLPLGEIIPPAPMNEALQREIAAAAERRVPGGWLSIPSGAGHDAAIFADRIPAGMLFVPSIGGVSHSFLEHTSEEDIVLGCQVMADSAVAVLEALR